METIGNMGTTAVLSEEHIGDIPNLHLSDDQARLVYEAEEQCGFWNDLTVLSLAEVKDLVKRISVWAGVFVPKVITEGHTDSTIAYATSTSIVLPFPFAKSLPYICHEMAHVINYQSVIYADHHGKNFTSVYLQIVRAFASPRNYLELKKAFDKTKVQYFLKESDDLHNR